MADMIHYLHRQLIVITVVCFFNMKSCKKYNKYQKAMAHNFDLNENTAIAHKNLKTF